MGRKISNICLKQGQSMRDRAAPPQPGIHRVPPPPPSWVQLIVRQNVTRIDYKIYRLVLSLLSEYFRTSNRYAEFVVSTSFVSLNNPRVKIFTIVCRHHQNPGSTFNSLPAGCFLALRNIFPATVSFGCF